MKIANHLSFKPNFVNYMFKEDMISDGIENCVQYIHNFDPAKSQNPFAYFTQIIHYAFLRRIQRESVSWTSKIKLLRSLDTARSLMTAILLTDQTIPTTIRSRIMSTQTPLLMKVAIITDTHYGARKNSKLFHDYFLKFYNDIFFPTIDKEGISTILHLGDAFDNRTGINFAALSWAKNNIFDPIKERGINVHLIVGNHDSYYKNTNDVNAVDLLLREYDNVNVYSEATEILVDKLKILFVPWINAENEKQTLKLIESTDCKVSMGHLELSGFADSINKSSWTMVMIANYLRSSRKYSAVTITLDQLMEESHIWVIPMKCSGTM